MQSQRTLPPELWLKILEEHVSDKCVKRLRSVNSVFFDAYLSIQYHTVKLEIPGHGETSGEAEVARFEHLREPHISRRVRHLHLIPQDPLGPIESPKGYRRAFDRIIHSLVQRPTQSKPSAEYAARTIVTFRSVSELTLVWKTTSFGVRPCIDAASRSFGSSLKKLHLLLDARTLSDEYLPFSDFTGPLQTLDIRLWVPSTPQIGDQAGSYSMEPLLDYVNKVSSSLQVLSILSRVGLSRLLQGLEQIPTLTTLAVNGSPDGLSDGPLLSQLAPFLQQHPQVNELAIRTTRGWSMQVQDIGLDFSRVSLAMNALQSLKIDVTKILRQSAAWNAFIAFLGQVAPTLVSFTLEGGIYSYREYESRFIDVIRTLGKGSTNLQELSIEFSELRHQHIVLLSTYLPSLPSLTLSMDYVETDRDRGTPQYSAGFFNTWVPRNSEFVHLMEKHDYSEWQLQDLTLRRYTSCCECILLSRFMVEFARCIPSIKSFAHRGDLTFPEDLDASDFDDPHEIWCPHGFPSFPSVSL